MKYKKNKGRVKNFIRNFNKNFSTVNLKFCCFHDFSGTYTQNGKYPLNSINCLWTVMPPGTYPSCKYWFQIHLWYVLVYYCFWLFILHLHHQNAILEKILEHLMALDFGEERMTMLFAPELQNIFIFTFINPNWNEQFEELYFCIIHSFFSWLPLIPTFSICPLVKHQG